MYDLAVQLRDRCRAAGVLFFVNDRVDVAMAAEADGVHVGVHDLPLQATRRLIGRGMILGYSPAHMAARGGCQSQAARTTSGSVRSSRPARKRTPSHRSAFSRWPSQAAAAGIPSVGIGGIDVANAGAVIRAGVDGVAVISAIQGAANPRQAAESLALAVNLAKIER